ncbi:sporulation transcriptional regulator SpoIIID [Acutalibacter caecimuris]|uniref:sporulation transcriptional regulator SpoIIID n=1 Tax=Acutalibacter caecimuris TaxID=3093657 RepID=UPI002AC9342F|nr:sporulation transcriptional regulator SpoIIID [Acutalibacter sp. M00118]
MRTTIHKDVSQRLKYIDRGLYRDVKNVLAVNKAQRHIRGGMATKKKYESLK